MGKHQKSSKILKYIYNIHIQLLISNLCLVWKIIESLLKININMHHFVVFEHKSNFRIWYARHRYKCILQYVATVTHHLCECRNHMCSILCTFLLAVNFATTVKQADAQSNDAIRIQIPAFYVPSTGILGLLWTIKPTGHQGAGYQTPTHSN